MLTIVRLAPRLLLPLICAVGSSPALSDDPTDVVFRRGTAVYEESCASCHGATGLGNPDSYAEPLQGDLTVGGLTRLIADTMPEGDPDSCTDAEAEAVAAYIHQAFYSEAAQLRQRLPRISLARLTGPQLRQSLADLYAHQTGMIWNVAQRGLMGQYFEGTSQASDKRRIDRIDPVLDFDFAHDGPGTEIPADDFSVAWRAGLRADTTGRYEIAIHSTCAFKFYLGENRRMFIDNHVQSGDRTEFHKSVTLTGGRVYPIRIHFFQRKRRTEQPPAKISLSWIPPGGIEQVIPNDHLLPVHAPPAFALQTWLPPDDRSYGFERGISVDRQWDDSTTEAAIEFGGMAADELWPRYRDQHKDHADENRAILRAFLNDLLATAFRRDIDDTTRSLYIDSQVDETADDAEAIRRVLLAAIKSPRFLYPLIDADQSPSRRAANRLTLTLFDSLPADEWILDRVRDNTIESEQQIREVAWAMVNDNRTRFKTRQLMREWLYLRRTDDVTKDESLFPDFDDALVSDLRMSLDQFLDEIVWSETSDYRQLFLSDWSFTTPRIADHYGDSWLPHDNQTTTRNRTVVRDERTGLLGHPYLMSSLAYRDSTSPIHRGVFLIRHILGRTLRPPNEAFTPISPDLHPDLTTRERVELQTGSDSCQVCHRKINGLGFVLESFDAAGRQRQKERGRQIDATGFYVSRSGDEVRFEGPEALAKYLAESDDAHRAFVDRAFRHFVKQPTAAWGPDTLNQLTQRFRANDCSIRMLLIEIAVIAATPPKLPPHVAGSSANTSQ